MKRAYTDDELRQILGAGRADSEIINQKMQEAYEEIRRRGNSDKIIDISTGKGRDTDAQDGRGRGKESGCILKRAAGCFGAAAAAFVMAMIFCAANPALAQEIPILGGIFNTLQGLVTFGAVPEDEIIYLQEEHSIDESGNAGNLGGTSVGQVMQEQTVGAADILEASEASGETALTQYQAEDQGLTVTLTEYYASNQSISIGVRVESEEPFPEMAVMLAEPRHQLLQLSTTETYSFRDEGDMVVNGFRNLEGKMMDEHTFEGVMRIDYESIRWDDRKYSEAYRIGEEEAEKTGVPFEGIEINDETFDDWISEYEVPESFQMQLAIQNFRIYTYKEKYIVRGSWTFPTTLKIRQSTRDTATIWINETNEYGWGVEYVELSPAEVTVHSIQPDGSLSIAVPIVLDKNNKPLVFGTNGSQFGTYGRDTSVITIYVCGDEIDLINEAVYLPGGALDEELYVELLDEKAQYKKTIDTTLYMQEK